MTLISSHVTMETVSQTVAGVMVIMIVKTTVMKIVVRTIEHEVTRSFGLFCMVCLFHPSYSLSHINENFFPCFEGYTRTCICHAA